MKYKIILVAFIALIVGTFGSCKNGGMDSYPILYVVNTSDYSVEVYFDNYMVTSVGAHNNSGKVVLSNTSINLPVYVEVKLYDKKGNEGHASWDDYYFKWNKSYKMTITNSTSKITVL